MKILIDIPDDKAAFAIKVLKSLSFIKKVNPISGSAMELWADLKEATDQVKLHKQGKGELKSARELLDEL